MLRDYDIQTYNDMETMLIEYGECCLVGHTGIGKTRISIEFVERYNLNTLVISNRLSINKSWEKTAAENGVVTISTVTIQTFVKAYKMFVDGFDCYIFDEAHHLGANTWFTAYKKFRQIISEECFVIGATATSKRYFDGKGINDITESVFNNHAVYCIDRKEAIELGIISNASYVYALYNVSEYAKEYFDKDMTDELRGKLDFAVKNQPQIADILIKYAPKGNKKGIVYVDRIKSIDDAVQLISTAFPKDPVWYIHSKLPAEEVTTVYEEFAKCKNGFIINVDMISEGIHPNDVNMVVMLRKTISPNKFTQQSGRISNTKVAVIFDFVGNRTSIAKVIARGSLVISKRKPNKNIKNVESTIDNDYRMVVVDAYTSDFLSILDEIDSYCGSRLWSKDQDEFLRQNYLTMPIKEIAEHLGRTAGACSVRAGSLGIRKNKYWTDEQDEFLRQNHRTMSFKQIAEQLGRTEAACGTRARLLGLRKEKEWSKDEDEFLKQNYRVMTFKEIAEHLGRSKDSCKARSGILGIRVKKQISHKLWTDEQDEFLRQNYLTMPIKEIAEHLGRSEKACTHRANRIGLRKTNDWTEEQDEFLRQHYSTKNINEIAEYIGRTEGACITRASSLGLRRACIPVWTQKEDEFLKQNFLTMSLKDIAKHLGRTRDNCKRRASMFGLRKIAKWTKKEDEFLKQNYFSMSLKDISKYLGRTEKACLCRAKKELRLRKCRDLTQEEYEILMQYHQSKLSNSDAGVT